MALPNLEDFLKLNAVNKGHPFTHTRIGDKESKISGGLYNIIDNKKFLDKYYVHVFENHNKEYQSFLGKIFLGSIQFLKKIFALLFFLTI